MSLLTLLDTKEMVVVCGSGGTGKTTVAAALGLQAAERLGGRVLVLTVDPARRLADALGLASKGPDGAGLGNTPVRVVTGGKGELWVAMLDTKAGWDELIRRHAPDPTLRDRVLANPLYRNITGRFVNSHDYIAMEQLHELHAGGRFDLVIIDTPPSRNALDLLDAPGRMREFFGSALLKWLTVPYRSRLFTVATKPFNQIADRILGSRFLQDIAEFFILFRTMEAGFVQRATEVERLLTDERTTFVVVTTLEPAPAHEARFLAEALLQRRMPLGAVVLNRTLPAAIRAPIANKAADAMATLARSPHEVADVARAAGVDAADATAVLADVAARFADVRSAATREAERRTRLDGLAPMMAEAPLLPTDVHDLDGLRSLGGQLIGAAGRRRSR